MDIVPFAPQPPALYQVGQRVRIFGERGNWFGKVTAGPSQRPSDFGRRNAPRGYFVSDENTGLVSAVMTPNIGPVLADPAELVPLPPATLSYWNRFDAWAKENQVSLGLLLAALTLAVGIAALFLPK